MIFLNLIFERQSNSKTTAKNPKAIFHFVLEIFGKKCANFEAKKPRDTKRFIFLHFVPVTSVVVIQV